MWVLIASVPDLCTLFALVQIHQLYSTILCIRDEYNISIS